MLSEQMPVEFLYGRREALVGKSEAFKRSVRKYLESFGFSQTIDAIIEGTFQDMIFVNPVLAPGKHFVVETKAEELSLRSKKLARELIKYFRLWRSQEISIRFKFLLFAQAVKNPSEWELMFSETNNLPSVNRWCSWYNDKCLETDECSLKTDEVRDIAKFFAESTIIVGNSLQLDTAALERRNQSDLSIPRMAENLLRIINKRKTPIMRKSIMVMNIIPISVPEYYYTCNSSASSKKEIYKNLEGKIIPPFIWRKDKTIMSFARFDQNNPLCRFTQGPIISKKTKELQIKNPTLSAELVNIYLRRILWNKGLYRDEEIFYFPMLDKSKNIRTELDKNGNERWVTKKIIRARDTKYGKKGDVNFYFHRAVELKTPTYWGTSYVEITPRKYYTFDGETPLEGEIRAKIDAKFRNPYYDRPKARLGLMKFWKYTLFESKIYRICPEEWFGEFKFGDFVTKQVDWSPNVIGKSQTRLWDFSEEHSNASST